ncbi:hypothetical protein SCLCIDRAFT_1221664 [Scleroderma citrinum Foug A]|uniref:Major facilitator superfamily (MFS) profile domain-containing protein n=1 Tax=Scleroderma citrinum Foug A TaxID=1036808 RepID=A0A0C3D1Y3_9AGAM|nr:hypothetical protein SCLCIDRAFT_1221664 [Scleroderma citrinum Foug A]
MTTNENTPLLRKNKTPLPKFQLSLVLLLVLAEPISAQYIFPFINQLIRELGVTGGDDRKIGYYAGLIQSLFYITQALTILHWSRLSDYIGRKPVLLIGLMGLSISNMCFGLSTTLSMIIASRCIAGALNGNIGVMKSVIADITDHTNLAQAFVLVPPVFSVGASIAPLYGGVLAKPHDRWPALFSGIFWQKYPYFLPCLVSVSFTAVAFLIAALFLKESSPHRQHKKHQHLRAGMEDTCVDVSDKDTSPVPICTLMKTYSVMLPIATYGALALVDIGFISLLPLFYATPIEIGGLGLPPSAIGTCLAIYGLFNGLFQVLFISKLIDRFGEKKILCTTVLAFFPLIAMFPMMSLLVQSRQQVGPSFWPLMALQLCFALIGDMSYSVISVFVMRAVPNRYSLGTMNGLSQTMNSVARAFGPATFSSLFAFSKEHNILGGNCVYPIVITLAVPVV